MTAVFSSVNIDTSMNIDNNLAYVKSWAECIKTKPDFLTKAIKAAQEAADYMDMLIGFACKKNETENEMIKA